jgi:hypothetical protein
LQAVHGNDEPAANYVSGMQGRMEQDSLTVAMRRAWERPRRWQRVSNPDDGVNRVICIPKTGKNGSTYWCWGYQLTIDSIQWRATRTPFEEPKEPVPTPVPVPKVERVYDQLSLYDLLMKGHN